MQPTLHVGTVSTELLRTTQPKWRYRIDLEQRYSTYGKDHSLLASVKQSKYQATRWQLFQYFTSWHVCRS